MEKIAPEIYPPFVVIEKGEKVLYVQLLNALYGTLKAALLSYKRLVKELKEDRFTLNPYDGCVANKIVNGKQMTVVWHVDDLKVSHVDPQEINIFVAKMKDIFEDENGKMQVTRGKHHEYLGMDLDFSNKGEVKISMIPYVKKMLKEFPIDINSSAPTPAALHFFQV